MHNKVMSHISFILVFALLLPVIAGEALNAFFPYKLVDFPLHSLFESIGGFIALSISAFLYYRSINTPELYKKYIWIIIGLSTMGIFDIFHAVLEPGNNFVWLHSLAAFSGGVFFSMIWLSRLSSFTPAKGLISFFIISSLVIAVYSLIYEQSIPMMLNKDGSFSVTANILNLGGGLFFIIATLFFISEYKNTLDEHELLFVGHTLLFGIAGLLFNTSMLFDLEWWFWHLLRLIAYMFAQYFIILLFLHELKAHKKAQEELQNFNFNLQERINRELNKQQAKQHLEAKSSKINALSAMISMISSRWKAPLNKIDETLHLLINKQENSHELREIQEELSKLDTIIQELSELHQFSQDQAKQSLRDALESAIDIMSPLFSKNGINIQTQYKQLSRSKDYTKALTQVFLYVLQYLGQKTYAPELHHPQIDISVDARGDALFEVIIHENFSQSDDNELFNQLIDNTNPLQLATSILKNDYNGNMLTQATQRGSKTIIQLGQAQ